MDRQTNEVDEIIRGIRQGGEAAGLARVIKKLKEKKKAAEADRVMFRGQTTVDYYKGKSIAYQVAAELVEELQKELEAAGAT